METYKELYRHNKNEEKQQELINCFEKIWTASNIFGRLGGTRIKSNVTPHMEFLPRELGAWMVPPIRVQRLSPSPDLEAKFVARPDFPDLVHDFLQGISNNRQAPSPMIENSAQEPNSTERGRETGENTHLGEMLENSQRNLHLTPPNTQVLSPIASALESELAQDTHEETPPPNHHQETRQGGHPCTSKQPHRRIKAKCFFGLHKHKGLKPQGTTTTRGEQDPPSSSTASRE